MGQCYCLEGAVEQPRDSMMINNLGGKDASASKEHLRREIGIDELPVHLREAAPTTQEDKAAAAVSMSGDIPLREPAKTEEGLAASGAPLPLSLPPTAADQESVSAAAEKRRSPVSVDKGAMVVGTRRNRKESPAAMKAGHTWRKKAIPDTAADSSSSSSSSRETAAHTFPRANGEAVRTLQGLDKDGLIQLIVTAGVAEALLVRAAVLRVETAPALEAVTVHAPQHIEQQQLSLPRAPAAAPVEEAEDGSHIISVPSPSPVDAAGALRAMAADLDAEAEGKRRAELLPSRPPVPKMLVALAVNKTASKLLARKARSLPGELLRPAYKEPMQLPVEESAMSLQPPAAAAPDMAQPYELVFDGQLPHQSSYRVGQPTREEDLAERTKQRFREYSRLAALPDDHLRKEFIARGVPRDMGSYPSRHTICLALVKHIFQDAPPQQKAVLLKSSGRGNRPVRAPAPEPSADKPSALRPTLAPRGRPISPLRRASTSLRRLDSSRISGSSINRLDSSEGEVDFLSSAESRRAASFMVSPGGGGSLHAHFGQEL